MLTTDRSSLDQSSHLEHFIKLAMRGRHAGASGGEKRAYRLAKQIADDASGLDRQALSGLCQFVYAAADSPTDVRELLD